MNYILFIILQVFVFGGLILFMRTILTKNTQTAVGRLDAMYEDLIKKQKETIQAF